MPDPANYSNEDDFVSACIKTRQDEHPQEDIDQSSAICYSMWAEKKMKQPIVRKTHVSESEGLEYILSDASIDRYGDSILADGWDLKNFSRNPIALFNHDSNFPVGRWECLQVKDGALRGRLRLAPDGTSSRIDEIRKLVEAGILKAVSVGFRPIESQPLKSGSGSLYMKQELVETSLVSVPANANALQVSRSLKISEATIKAVFAEHGTKETVLNRSGGNRGEYAGTSRSGKTDTVVWQGKEVPVERHVIGDWRGEKLYRY